MFAGVAGLIAVIFTVLVVPNQSASTTGLMYFALRWCHGIARVMIALSFLVRAFSDASAAAEWVGLAGSVAYIAFVIALTRTGG